MHLNSRSSDSEHEKLEAWHLRGHEGVITTDVSWQKVGREKMGLSDGGEGWNLHNLHPAFLFRMKKFVWKDVPNPNKCSWAKGFDLRKVNKEKLQHLAFKNTDFHVLSATFWYCSCREEALKTFSLFPKWDVSVFLPIFTCETSSYSQQILSLKAFTHRCIFC